MGMLHDAKEMGIFAPWYWITIFGIMCGGSCELKGVDGK
jgi:hypothetical protein